MQHNTFGRRKKEDVFKSENKNTINIEFVNINKLYIHFGMLRLVGHLLTYYNLFTREIQFPNIC